MKLSLLKYLVITSSMLLVACSTTVKNVIVSTELQMVSNNAYQQKQAELMVTDQRLAKHIVQITKDNIVTEGSKRYFAQQALKDIITRSLTNGFKTSSLQLQPNATTKIEIVIDKAIINVVEDLVKYTANNEIVLRVIAKNNHETLTKTFKRIGTSNGPFNADMAVLERDFNQKLTKLLTDIIQNNALQEFINQKNTTLVTPYTG